MTRGSVANHVVLIRHALLYADPTVRRPALDALARVAAASNTGEAAVLAIDPDHRAGGLVARRRRKRATYIIVEAVEGVAEFSPHSPTTLIEDAFALVAEMVADDLALIRTALLDSRSPVGVPPVIDALDHIAAALDKGGVDDAA